MMRLFSTAHGTFLGHIRLEAHKPQQVPIDSTMSFGASTRVYTIREKPQSQANVGSGDKTGDDEELKGLLGLPEEETELEVRVNRTIFFFFPPSHVHVSSFCILLICFLFECMKNLTEFNTAHNKRISTLTIEEGNLDIQRPKRKRKSSRVSFNEDDEVINPGKCYFENVLIVFVYIF